MKVLFVSLTHHMDQMFAPFLEDLVLLLYNQQQPELSSENERIKVVNLEFDGQEEQSVTQFILTGQIMLHMDITRHQMWDKERSRQKKTYHPTEVFF